jgi:deoxyribose-phosphate aldolase
MLSTFDESRLQDVPVLEVPSLDSAPPSREELLDTIRFIDLTTLAGDDSSARVEALARRALVPISGAQVAAVCVYPAFIAVAKSVLDGSKVAVATVAAAFPHGLSPLSTRVAEVEASRDLGADEIDIVIRRSHALEGNWDSLYEEISAFKVAASPAHLKVILATGELADPGTIYRASIVAMQAGADFIKTSTGKESVNATLEAANAMLTAIRDWRDWTGEVVGFKAAGGIRTAQQAVSYQRLAALTLGGVYLDPTTFRLGASSLLDEVSALL